jgi:hypothetical protein
MVNLGPTEEYNPRPGDIGLVRISGAGGKVIRALQWANGCGFEDYEHALGVTVAGRDGHAIEVVEAEPGGARRAAFSYAGHTRWLVCPDGLRELMVSNLNRCADNRIPYSWLDYAAVGAHTHHVPMPGLKHYIESSQHMMCSQLVDWCAMKSGWHLFQDHRWPGYVPPCDLNALWHTLRDRNDGSAY